MYRALDISRHVVKRCWDNGTRVNNQKLQEILYFIQGEFLARMGRECFPEDIEAWDLGPVVPEIYDRYLPFGNADIPYMGLGDSFWIRPADEECIDEVIDNCSIFPAGTLLGAARLEDPWRDHHVLHGRQVIPKEDILSYFMEEGA